MVHILRVRAVLLNQFCNLSITCQSFSVDHTMVAMPFAEIYVTASLLLKYVIMLQLDRLYFRDIFSCICNTTNDALDIRTRGFWSRSQDAHFDVTQIPPVISPLALLLLINIIRIPRSVNIRTNIEHGVSGKQIG